MIDRTLRIHRYYLMTDHIRSCPLVILRPSFHRKATPDTVYLPDSTSSSFFPVNLSKHCPVTELSKCFFGNLHINSRRITMLVRIVIGWEYITSYNDRRSIVLFISGFFRKMCAAAIKLTATHSALSTAIHFLCTCLFPFVLLTEL